MEKTVLICCYRSYLRYDNNSTFTSDNIDVSPNHLSGVTFGFFATLSFQKVNNVHLDPFQVIASNYSYTSQYFQANVTFIVLLSSLKNNEDIFSFCLHSSERHFKFFLYIR